MGAQSQAFENVDATRKYNKGLTEPQIANLGDQAQRLEGAGGYYRNWSDDQYKGLEDNPGYTQAQRDAITSGGLEGGYNSLLYGPQDASGAYLSPEEQAGYRGDPYAGRDILNPDYINDVQGEGFKRQNEQVDAGQGRLNSAVSSLREGLDSSVTPDIQLGDDYAHNQDATVVAGAGNVRGAIGQGGTAMRGAVGDLKSSVNPNQVQASDRYLSRMDVTPEEMDQIRSSGARSVAAQNTAAQQQIKNAIYQGGSSDPFAEAAMQAQMNRDSGASEADAALQGELAAQNTMRGVEQAREDTRMKGGSAAGSLALNVGKAALDTEGHLMDTSTAAEDRLLNTALTTQQQNEAMRLAAAQNAAKMRQYNAATAGQADLGAQEYNTNLAYGNTKGQTDTALATERANQDRMYAATQAAEQAQQQRNAELAKNRQGTQQYNSQQQFQRGAAVAGANTANATNVANAARADTGEARKYTTGQGQFATGAGLQAEGLKNQAIGTAVQGQTAADSNYVSAAKGPSAGDKAMNWFSTIAQAGKSGAEGGIFSPATAMGEGGMVPLQPPFTYSPMRSAACGESSAAVGKIITHPQPVMLGENGPELVIPLQNLEDAKTSMATMDKVNPGLAQGVAMRGALEGTGDAPGAQPAPNGAYDRATVLRSKKLRSPVISYNPIPGGAYA